MYGLLYTILARVPAAHPLRWLLASPSTGAALLQGRSSPSNKEMHHGLLLATLIGQSVAPRSLVFC